MEKNINVSLQNIKENGIGGNSGKHRDSGDGEDWTNKGGKYGFNKEYKLESTDRWTDSSPNGFKAFKLKAELYLFSAKPQYAESLKILLPYVQSKETAINLKEVNSNDELVHDEILKKATNAEEVDTMLFNELMNMLSGDTAIMRYIAQNVKKSGLEIWRKLHPNNDPNTYNTKDSYRRMIEQLSANRTKNTKELSEKFDKLEAAFDQYELLTGTEYNQEDKLHRLINILPSDVYQQLSIIMPMERWKYINLKMRVQDMVNISYRFQAQETISHGTVSYTHLTLPTKRIV